MHLRSRVSGVVRVSLLVIGKKLYREVELIVEGRGTNSVSKFRREFRKVRATFNLSPTNETLDSKRLGYSIT